VPSKRVNLTVSAGAHAVAVRAAADAGLPLGRWVERVILKRAELEAAQRGLREREGRSVFQRFEEEDR